MSEQSRRPMQSGGELASSLGPLRLGRVNQRNWSRVATAATPDGTRLFVKQFFDARGRWLDRLVADERATCALLAALSPTSFVPVLPLAAESDHAVLVYELLEIETLDSSASRCPASHPTLARAIEAFAHELTELAASSAPIKEPAGASGALTRGWKGLDVKNISLRRDGRLTVFDFGPSYRAPRSEPIARLIGSALAANWGRPLRRTIAGPPEWTYEVLGSLRGATSRNEVQRYLDRVREVRRSEPQPSGFLERVAMPPLTALLERWYWPKAELWIDTHIGHPRW